MAHRGGQAVPAAHCRARGEPGVLEIDFPVGEPLENLFQGHPSLQPGKGCANAEMHSLNAIENEKSASVYECFPFIWPYNTHFGLLAQRYLHCKTRMPPFIPGSSAVRALSRNGLAAGVC